MYISIYITSTRSEIIYSDGLYFSILHSSINLYKSGKVSVLIILLQVNFESESKVNIKSKVDAKMLSWFSAISCCYFPEEIFFLEKLNRKINKNVLISMLMDCVKSESHLTAKWKAEEMKMHQESQTLAWNIHFSTNTASYNGYYSHYNRVSSAYTSEQYQWNKML